MDNFFNSKRILDVLLKWKIQLAVVIVAAILLSIFFSSPIIIKPLYKSDAVIYPSNISPYSDENETEQSVQIFQAGDIRDSVVKKFDLARHWEIDSNYRFFKSTLLWIYNQRVNISKTPYEAVQIEVWDPDPQVACNIVNALMDFYNIKIRSLHKEKFEEVVANYNYIIAKKQGYLDSLKDAATKLGTKYGLLEYQSQTKEVMRAYLSTGGGSVRSAEAKALKKNMEEKGGEMLLLSEMIRSEAAMFSTMKLDADRALLDYNRNYTYVNVLSKPFPADKKAYPVRWLIVVVSTMGAFFLALLIIGVIENRRFRQLSTEQHEG